MTSERPLPPMPGFPAFYRALNRRDPFPWQARLAAQVAGNGQWPLEIGVPTGLGKTACLDIAIWSLASQADRDPTDRTAPTRTWWVVNRRLLVDSTADHAQTISAALKDPATVQPTGGSPEVVAAVADRLRSLSSDPGADPLEVIRLRGGVSWRRPTDPSSPAVVLSTLPMYGSRLLFRGYGSRAGMRPIDAALAGTDSLVLLDEAHLAPHLRTLVPALRDCSPQAQPVLGASRSWPQMVALTATGNPSGVGRFDLNTDDEAHPVVQQRLDAVKPLDLRVTTGEAGPRLTEATLDLVGDAPAPSAFLVFANTPRTARDVFKRLRSKCHPSAEVLLSTGRSREPDAERVRQRILDQVHGMTSTRDEGTRRERHLIVVATQTLEVGADLDAEYLVTETCGVRALTQRLGRLNRLGLHPHSRAVYVHTPPPKKKGTTAKSEAWPVYGSEPKAVQQRIETALPDGPAPAVNLSPRRIASLLGPPGDDPGRAPEILPGLLWEWVKTTTPPRGEAPVEPYFSGVADPQYSVSLIWRAHLPEPGERLWPRVRQREAVDVPIGEVRQALDGNDDLRRLGSDGVTIEKTSRQDLRPGDVLVLGCDQGLLDEFGWNPSASSPVKDLSLQSSGLPLNPKAIERLCGIDAGSLIKTALGVGADDDDLDPDEQRVALERILEDVAAVTPAGWKQSEWHDFLDALPRKIITTRNETARLQVVTPSPEWRGERSDEHDEFCLSRAATELDRHGEAVGARARRIADRLGLQRQLAEITERAGLLHDIGKADGRFQRWLDPHEASGGVLLAKSNRPRHLWEADRAAAGWPKGGRHEALSARLVNRWLEEHPDWGNALTRNLLLHLIVSHHGKARPLVVPVTDETASAVYGVVLGDAVHAAADLSATDWEQPARFKALCDYFNPWGLALLEAVVRQADHAVSGGADNTLRGAR